VIAMIHVCKLFTVPSLSKRSQTPLETINTTAPNSSTPSHQAPKSSALPPSTSPNPSLLNSSPCASLKYPYFNGPLLFLFARYCLYNSSHAEEEVAVQRAALQGRGTLSMPVQSVEGRTSMFISRRSSRMKRRVIVL
jgi:hypothetical protein